MNEVNYSYFLPNIFKKVGWVIIGACLVSYLIVLLVVEFMEWLTVRDDVMIIMALIPILATVGLALVVSAREKQEDEMIRLIRLRSFQYGIYIAVGIFILKLPGRFLYAWLGGIRNPLESIWNLQMFLLFNLDTITGTLLFIAAIYHYKLYRLRHAE